MKAKKTALVTVLLLSSIGLMSIQAQQAILSSGGDALSDEGSLSYSVGQVLYESIICSNFRNDACVAGSMTFSVQQPIEFTTVGIDDLDDTSYLYSIYPNPAASNFTLQTDDAGWADLTLWLFDLNGKLIWVQNATEDTTAIPLDVLTSGIYFLKLANEKKHIKTFKIIKNQ